MSVRHRWSKALLAAAVTGLLGLTACAPSANQVQGSEKQLRVAFTDGGSNLDPAESEDPTGNSIVIASYDQLVRYAEKDGEVSGYDFEPMLASDWKESEDGLRWTFTLRDDVKFQSGNLLTADDVVYSMDHVYNSASSQGTYELALIESVTAADDSTVEIQLQRPNPALLTYLVQYTFSILDSKLLEEQDDPKGYLTKNPAGSGPFILESWDPSSGAHLSAYEDYWDGPAASEQISLSFIPEMSTQIQQLKKGDLNFAYGLPQQYAKDLENTEGVEVFLQESNRLHYLGLNNEDAVFADPKVRQALAYALPYDLIVDQVLEGLGRPARSALATGMPGFDGSTDPYSHDQDRARQLLAEAGYPDGFGFTLTVSGSDELGQGAAVVIQDALQQIGVSMEISSVAHQQYLEARSDHSLQAFIGAWLSFVNDPTYHLGHLLVTDAAANFTNYSNPEVDRLVDEASLLQGDEANVVWKQVQQLISEDSPWLYLYEPNKIGASSEGTTGFVGYPDELLRLAHLKHTTESG